jgi:predicted dehydrogenase
MTIRLGFISFAHMHAYRYASCLRSAPGVALVGVWDEDRARAAQMAHAFEMPALDSVEALLEQGLDGVVICSENWNHRPHVELAARSVPNILCEKPIATTLADAQAMIDACEAAGARLEIAFPVRFAPAVQRLKELLDEDTLGRIYAVKSTNRGGMPGGWFTDPKMAGGGAVIDHTVHVIDLLRWFWSTEVTEVYAEIGYGLLHPGLAIDDAGVLSFTLASGAYGTLDTSWSRPQGYHTWGDVTVEVVGELGTAWADAFNQTISVTSDEVDGSPGRLRSVPWGSDPDMGLMRDFLDMVGTGRDPFITGLDGLRALEVALAAYRSADCGRAVALPLSQDV